MKPYVYLVTGKSKDLRRDAPTGARIAGHLPDLGRSVELQFDQNGRWMVAVGPAPGHGGQFQTVAEGHLRAAVTE